MKKERRMLIEFDATKLTLKQLESCISMGLNPSTIEETEAISWLLKNRRIDIIKLMGSKDIIDLDYELSSALSECIDSNDIELAKYLLENGVKPTQDDVIEALEEQHIKLAKILIQMLDDEYEKKDDTKKYH